MKSRPILFTGPMVKAILSGAKTQTRRIVKPQPEVMYEYPSHPEMTEFLHDTTSGTYSRESFARFRCKYGTVGDQLWVREKWRLGEAYVKTRLKDWNYPEDLAEHVHYAADDDAIGMPMNGQYRPSIFMPRWASRITLEITGVRVERLNDIGESDAMAEGCHESADCEHNGSPGFQNGVSHMCYRDRRAAFKGLWESINGPGSWAANPFVWVIEFRRITQ